MPDSSKRLVRMLDGLGRVTDEPGQLTRTFLSPGMKRANQLVANWMKGAGLKVRVDSVGNLIGRLESKNRGAKTLLLGSHLDTVRDAGKFDGPLGVLLPIVALGDLKRRGVKLPFAVEVLGFSEEEGVRFASAYLGSEGYAGRLKNRRVPRIRGRESAVRRASRSAATATLPFFNRRRVGAGRIQVDDGVRRSDCGQCLGGATQTRTAKVRHAARESKIRAAVARPSILFSCALARGGGRTGRRRRSIVSAVLP